VGAVGLGAGTIAALGRSVDHIRFYEINPAVKAISEQHFTFRQDSLAATEVIIGDARLQLEEELRGGAPLKFDVLAVDAFNSDAIPIHLLTREAVDIYWKHLAPEGLLLFHISNHSLDLAPIVRAHAEYLGCEAVRVIAAGDTAKDTNYNTWVVLTQNRDFLDSLVIKSAVDPWTEKDAAPLAWTDDFAGLWHVLKF
jgi:spermidine synthase